MIRWEQLEEHLKIHHFYKIDNNSKQNIVLFGNCHLLPITFFLNKLFNYGYNFIVIISWFYEKSFDLNELPMINSEIQSIISQADIFIFQYHFNSFNIHANEITTYVNKNCKLIHIPNFILDYLLHKSTSFDMKMLKNEFKSSLFRLSESIKESDFPEFNFIIENIYKVRFFNTIYHPTHFLLYLLSQSIYHMLIHNPIKTTITTYYDNKVRDDFFKLDKAGIIFLPGKDDMEPIHHEITGIHYGADYYDLTFLT